MNDSSASHHEVIKQLVHNERESGADYPEYVARLSGSSVNEPVCTLSGWSCVVNARVDTAEHLMNLFDNCGDSIRACRVSLELTSAASLGIPASAESRSTRLVVNREPRGSRLENDTVLGRRGDFRE
ncbi:MAG: hypothetical protein J07HQX50_01550 [Haloquadratum sp. J07HQX50]|jgi:hypothetical protein|nr:MAG: hypothetical protein J07HQX50_01550 [Haloquadratum sp. J07HQX50]